MTKALGERGLRRLYGCSRAREAALLTQLRKECIVTQAGVIAEETDEWIRLSRIAALKVGI